MFVRSGVDGGWGEDDLVQQRVILWKDGQGAGQGPSRYARSQTQSLGSI